MALRYQRSGDVVTPVLTLGQEHNSGDWIFNFDAASMNDLQKFTLAATLNDLTAEVLSMADAESAEGQLRRELGRRLSALARSAQAAGKLSDMWSAVSSHWYKERKLITDQMR